MPPSGIATRGAASGKTRLVLPHRSACRGAPRVRAEGAGGPSPRLPQEFNREANTRGSKSVDSRTTYAAVELKVLIEQRREQVQHIE